MVALGLAGTLASLPAAALEEALRASWKRSAEALASNLAALQQGIALANGLPAKRPAPLEGTALPAARAGCSRATGGGLRRAARRRALVAAYPITPATELLEWMAPALTRLGGNLLQAEDELASVNMIIGASYGGVPSLTATAGPGLALMTEGIGLAVAAEVPIVVVDVMRGRPSTGIPAKERTERPVLRGRRPAAMRRAWCWRPTASPTAWPPAGGPCSWPRRCSRPRCCCPTSSWASRAR